MLYSCPYLGSSISETQKYIHTTLMIFNLFIVMHGCEKKKLMQPLYLFILRITYFYVSFCFRTSDLFNQVRVLGPLRLASQCVIYLVLQILISKLLT